MNRSLLTVVSLPLVALAIVGIPMLAVKLSVKQSNRPAPAASRPPTHHRCVGLSRSGRFAGVALNPPITQAVKSFTAATHVHPAVVEYYTKFGAPFQHYEASQAVTGGSVPFIQLNPRRAAPARIARGAYDSYLRRYAEAVQAFRCPVVLSFGHEMNGSWYPWGRPDTTPAQFIAAWKRIHNVFTAQHVTNVIWAWDPDHAGSAAREWWPGSAYVDWIGIDGYEYKGPRQSFAHTFKKQLASIRAFTSKPVFIAETAVAPGPQQPNHITKLFSAVTQHHLTGLVWFDVNRLEPWHLEPHSAAASAFQRSVMRMEKARTNKSATTASRDG